MTPEFLVAIAAVISACTAFVAVLIGPIINARIQHKRSVSTMRETWIHDLRQTLSELIGCAETAASIILPARAISPDLKEAYDQIVRLEAKAKMMLNIGDSDHRVLQDQLQKIVDLADNKNKKVTEKMSEMRQLTESIIPTSQVIFKEAWRNIR